MKTNKQTITYNVNGTAIGNNSTTTGFYHNIHETNVYGPVSGYDYYLNNNFYNQKIQNFDFDKNIESHITINKSRLKKYLNKIYLNDNDEFEFEFFNPNTSVYGVLIKINGEYISENKLILEPGKRIFLDRYINTSDKFKFKTYTVEDNNKDVDAAIRLNGEIKFEFYKEQLISFDNNLLLNQNKTYTYTDINTYNTGIYCGLPTNYDVFASNNIGFNDTTKDFNYKETGRIDKGTHSDTKFDNVDKQFNDIISFNTEYKILPISEKPIETKDLIRYCTKCSTKSKKEHIFCCKCGTKL